MASIVNMKPINLTGQVVIAMPGLADPNFFQTVIYGFSHNESGAMGIIINRPVNIALGEVFSQINLPVKTTVSPAFIVLESTQSKTRGEYWHSIGNVVVVVVVESSLVNWNVNVSDTEP